MKIGLVTFFKSYNYGAWLQAYGTQKFLELQGYDVEIIDYTNNFENAKTGLSYKEGDRFVGYITSFLKSILFGKVYYYNKGFKRYIKNTYKLSDKKFKNVSELEESDYDVLVVGSDQVWNPKITNGLDQVFLLQFGNFRKKLSIASSLGSKTLSDIEKNQLVNALKGFYAVSVREDFARDYLQGDFVRNIKVLVDPSFLLTKEQWIENVARKSKYFNNKENYILTYFVSNEKRKKANIELVEEYSRKYNMPVWAIQFSTYFSEGVNKKIVGASIYDFLALLYNAKLVITDSFHGAALSANLNINFVAIVNEENPVRTQNLLSKIGLLDRMNLKCSQYSDIDYTLVNKMIAELREDSQDWIIKNIED